MGNLLPAISKIEYILASSLFVSSDEMLTEGGIVALTDGVFTDLEIVGLASLSVTSEKQSGQDVYIAVIPAKKEEIIDETALLLSKLAKQDICYKLTDVHGNWYLLGTPEKPFPSLTYKYSNDSSPTGNRIFELEIKYVNLFSVLHIR